MGCMPLSLVIGRCVFTALIGVKSLPHGVLFIVCGCRRKILITSILPFGKSWRLGSGWIPFFLTLPPLALFVGCGKTRIIVLKCALG